MVRMIIVSLSPPAGEFVLPKNIFRMVKLIVFDEVYGKDDNC